jgi:hypothetical protein
MTTTNERIDSFYYRSIFVVLACSYWLVLCYNDLFIHEDGFKFGHPDHSISAVLGVNEYNGSLTSFGWLICAILDKIDADHCIKSAKEEGLLQ